MINWKNKWIFLILYIRKVFWEIRDGSEWRKERKGNWKEFVFQDNGNILKVTILEYANIIYKGRKVKHFCCWGGGGRRLICHTPEFHNSISSLSWNKRILECIEYEAVSPEPSQERAQDFSRLVGEGYFFPRLKRANFFSVTPNFFSALLNFWITLCCQE